MRLLVHNLLACAARTCSAPSNFPLHFKEVERIEVQEADFNEDFLLGFLPKLDWPCLVGAARELGEQSLPEVQPELPRQGPLNAQQAESLRLIHHVLLEMNVQEGRMICPSCGHAYIIREGIPNMLLAEHEVKRY